MKKTAFLLFAAALACAMAAALTGCATKRGGGLSPASQTAGLSMTNRVGVSIGNGQQVSGMMDKGSVLDSYAAVASAAIASKQEVAIIALNHGADKQPNVKDDKQTEKVLQDVLASGIAAAKSGGSEAELAKAGIEIVKGLAKLGKPEAEPTADNSSATVFALFAGQGANSAGVGAMAEGRMTRVEAIRAARSSVETVIRDSYKETVTADGLKTMTALAKMQAEIEKAKATNSPAAVVGGSQKPGSKPEDATPAAVPPGESGAGEPSDRPAYDTLAKKNYLYKTRLAKTNPVTRHDSAFLIPKDRPAVKSLYIPGQKVAENYFSESEDRWIIRLSGALPDTPSAAVATYADGNSETFHIDSLAGRTDKPAGPYKPAAKPEATKVEEPSDAGDAAAPGE